MGDFQAKVILKGGLNWYNENKVSEITVSNSNTKLRQVLESYQVPLEMVQFATVNGEMTKNIDYVVNDDDEIIVIPIVEGG